MQAVVGGARGVPEDPLDGLLMLCHQSLHQPTDVANGERQVQPCMDEVAKAAYNVSVLHGLDLLFRAVAAQLQPLLHGSVGWVAPVSVPNSTMRLAQVVWQRDMLELSWWTSIPW